MCLFVCQLANQNLSLLNLVEHDFDVLYIYVNDVLCVFVKEHDLKTNFSQGNLQTSIII